MSLACVRCGVVTEYLTCCDECRPHLNDNQKLRAMRAWHKAVVERDGYSCRRCGHSAPFDSGELCGDHVQTQGSAPELRYDVRNGETTCLPCHNRRHSSGLSSTSSHTMKKPEPTKKRTKPRICDKLGCPIYAAGKGAKKPTRCVKHQ